MRKLIVLAAVFAIAGGAEATVLSWSTDSVTMSLNATVTVQLIADDKLMFDQKWVGNSASSIANIKSISTIGGPHPQIDVVPPDPYPGWWTIAVLPPDPLDDIPTWDVTIEAGSVTGTHELYSDAYGTNNMLDITVVPEPVTIALLTIGALGIRIKRRR